MGFVQAVQSGFANYVNFSGRAPRSEYWYWVLFVIVASIVATILDLILFPAVRANMNGSGPISLLVALALLLPGIAISVRRLHDTDRSGWWALLAFIPFIGAIILIVWFCIRGTPGPNRFGSSHLIAQMA